MGKEDLVAYLPGDGSKLMNLRCHSGPLNIHNEPTIQDHHDLQNENLIVLVVCIY